jgi:hypothetical protein
LSSVSLPGVGFGQHEDATRVSATDFPLPHHRLSPSQAGSIAKRGRKLLRRGKITHREFSLLDALLWSCRPPDKAVAVVSSSRSASRATLALNSAEYRFRLSVIGSVLLRGRTELNQLSEIRGPPHCDSGT